MSSLLCIALYLAPTDTVPLYETCSFVAPDVSSEAIAACNRDTDHCEWIVAPENRVEWTIYPR